MSLSFSRNVYSSPSNTASRPPRKIENFENPKEFLMSIHDAIKEHQQILFTTGKIHGNINTDTVYIGARPGSPNPDARGFLIDSPIINPMFQSVNLLSKSVLKRKHTLPIDFLDDLESFYYIIAWVSMAYSAPGVRLRVSDYPFLLSCWAADPTSRASALEKEAMLFGEGFACGNFPDGVVFQGYNAGHVFESLLESFHSILKTHYNQKLLNQGSGLSFREMKAVSSVIYGEILKTLQMSVRLLDGLTNPNYLQELYLFR